MSNVDMTITVTENLIDKALDLYLRSIMTNLDNSVIKTTYTAGRGPNGISATIDISDKQAVKVSEPKEQTLSKISRTIPAETLAKAQPVEVQPAPVVKPVQPIVTKEPVVEEAPKKSAFNITEVVEEVQEVVEQEPAPVEETTSRKKPRFLV